MKSNAQLRTSCDRIAEQLQWDIEDSLLQITEGMPLEEEQMHAIRDQLTDYNECMRELYIRRALLAQRN